MQSRGPDNMGEYFDQRRRINAGHYWLRRSSGYEPSTFAWPRVLRLAVRRVSLRRPRQTLALVVAAVAELAARSAGRLDLGPGYYPYRLGTQSAGELPSSIDDSDAALERIRRTLDPAGVLAGSRYRPRRRGPSPPVGRRRAQR